MNRFGLSSLGRKLAIAICLIIATGFGAIVYFYAQQQERNILLQNERSIHQLLDSVNQGLQVVMITGSADVSTLYAEKLKGVGDIEDFRILRTNGLEAFKDNETVRKVNEFRDVDEFPLHAKEEKIQVLAPDDENLRKAIQTQQFVYFYNSRGGEEFLSFLLPIKSVKRCQRCHGRETPVLGVLELTASLAGTKAAVRQTWLQAGGVLAGALLAVFLVTTLVLNRYILRPIEVVSAAMKRVATGDLLQTVPILGRDELSKMATSFNHMTSELRSTYEGFTREHNKLETIIMGTEEGMVVSDRTGRIVLVNSAAEGLLGKDVARIVEQGLPAMLDDPQRMGRLLDRLPEQAAQSEVFMYHERFLAVHVSRICHADGSDRGHTVVIRDISNERRLEQQLRELSNIDALTGLANRRALDETLMTEFALAREQSRPLSILMFDIDHFKKFNDVHGHDQGDRVLKAFAQTAKSCVREVLDTVCRYGGEEFMVIARETPQDGAVVLAERIREAVAAMQVDCLKVTVSIGVAGLDETAAHTPSALIELADAALYRAKQDGRNRVRVASVGAA
ncbi:MAG: diguanylate cyclase [Sulfuritalea sp.]|nr:diguanylate cyclase [Sulfuritalea sp.]